MPLKGRVQQFGKRKDEVPVLYGNLNMIEEVGSSGLCLSLMAGGAEPAALAGKGQKVFMLTVIAADASKATFKCATVDKFIEDILNDWTKGAVVAFVGFRVVGHEGVVVAMDAFPER